MPEPKKPARRKPQPTSPWCNASVDVESLTETQRLAHELVVRRRDLTPSVERIMNETMDEAERTWALTAFSNALETPGDPHRDPRVAIASATAGSS